MSVQMDIRLRALVLAVVVCLLAVQAAAGHAILLESNPAKDATIKGTSLDIRLKYNSRVDGARSRLALVLPDGGTQVLKIAEQASPDTLTSAAANLKPGKYSLHWQVLATDGHITRGDIPFTVAGN